MLRFTAKGKIQVWNGTVLVSSHVQEREAYERISGLPPGRYTVTFPVIEVVSSGAFQSVYNTSSDLGRAEARGMAVQVVRLLSDTTPPAVPSGFSASAATATSVTLTLTANVESDFSNYVLERSSDNIGWGYLKSFTGTSTTDTVDVSGSTYYYRAFSIDTRGNRSAYTAVKSAGPYTVALSWNGTVPNFTFTRGNAENKDLSPYIIGNPSSITLETGTLPPGVTINSSQRRLQYDGTSSTATAIVSTGISLRLNSSYDADWQTRISGAGVVWYHSFDTANEVRNFRWNNASPAFGMDPNDLAHPNTCVWDSTGGVDGGGALRLRYPVGTNHGSAWGRPYSPIQSGTTTGNGRTTSDPGAGSITPISWNPSQVDALRVVNSGWYGHSSYSGDAVFDGTEYWVQFRFKIDADRYLNTGGNGTLGAQGGKLLYLDARDGSNQEIIWTNGKIPYFLAYTNFGSPTLAGPNNAIQYGSQWPNCGILDPPATYCYLMPNETWLTWLWHVKLGRQSTAETQVEVFVKDPNYAADYNGYTRVFSYNLLTMNYSSGKPRGHNVLHLTNYFNNWQNDYEWFSWYDQVIFSTQFIPAPTV